MNDEQRATLEDLERRKIAREDPCDSCDGGGKLDADDVCMDCLGQGVLLTKKEYDLLVELAGWNDDSILDEEIVYEG